MGATEYAMDARVSAFVVIFPPPISDGQFAPVTALRAVEQPDHVDHNHPDQGFDQDDYDQHDRSGAGRPTHLRPPRSTPRLAPNRILGRGHRRPEPSPTTFGICGG